MGYNGWALDEAEMGILRRVVVPKFPDLRGHHVTHQFGVGADVPLPTATYGRVWGYAQDESLEALLLEIDGAKIRPDGNLYHITWSLDKAAGRSSADSNAMIKQSRLGVCLVDGPINLIPRYWES